MSRRAWENATFATGIFMAQWEEAVGTEFGAGTFRQDFVLIVILGTIWHLKL